MRSRNIRILRELTDSLPSIVNYMDEKKVVYECEEGRTITGYNLLFEDNVAVQKSFLPKGCVFPKHLHGEVEYLVIYKGSIKVLFGDGSEEIVNTGNHIRFNPGKSHKVEAMKDTNLLGITIPASEVYPHGKQ